MDSAPINPPRGERQHNARLTPDIVRALRAEHMAYIRGRGYSALAKRYGVAWPTVRDVVTYRTWRHVR